MIRLRDDFSSDRQPVTEVNQVTVSAASASTPLP